MPIPYTLTPKAHAALDSPPLLDEWACVICADGYFGARPADDRCPGCRDDG